MATLISTALYTSRQLKYELFRVNNQTKMLLICLFGFFVIILYKQAVTKPRQSVRILTQATFAPHQDCAEVGGCWSIFPVC